MKNLLAAFPLALLSMHALAVEADKAPKSAEPVAVLLFIGGLIAAIVVFFVMIARSAPKEKKDPE